jgi:MFS family permease
MSPSRGPLERLGPFRHPPFAAYWAGGMVSNSGTWLQSVAGSVYVYDRTGSALAVGILNFATFLPILLFSVWGGRISDRFDRRAVVVVTHALSGALSLTLAIGIAVGIANEVHVTVVAFLLQTSWAIAKPSMVAMLPDLVPRRELTEAVGLNTLQFISGQLAGPVSATLILATLGPAWAFGINAATFLAPIASMAYLARRGLGGGAHAERRRAAGLGARDAGIVGYVREQPWVGHALLVVVFTSAIFEVIRTTAPVLVSERLGAATSTAGLVVAAQSVGSAIGILAFVPLQRRDLSRPVASAGLVLQAAGLVGLSLATSMPAALAAAVPLGMGFSLCFPVVTGALQGEVPDAMRGRLMSLHQMALLGNRPFTALAAGAIAASFGVPAALVAATLLVPFGLYALRSAWRRLDAPPQVGAIVTPAD